MGIISNADRAMLDETGARERAVRLMIRPNPTQPLSIQIMSGSLNELRVFLYLKLFKQDIFLDLLKTPYPNVFTPDPRIG